MDCCASELEPGGFGFAVEMGGQSAVERFKFGQVYLDTVVDGMFEVLVGKRAETRKSSADNICVVAMSGAGAHVEISDVINWVLVVCRVLKVSIGTTVF